MKLLCKCKYTHSLLSFLLIIALNYCAIILMTYLNFFLLYSGQVWSVSMLGRWGCGVGGSIAHCVQRTKGNSSVIIQSGSLVGARAYLHIWNVDQRILNFKRSALSFPLYYNYPQPIIYTGLNPLIPIKNYTRNIFRWNF